MSLDVTFQRCVEVPAHCAARLLLYEALGERVHQHRQVVFEPELVVRRSSQARQAPDG